MQATAKGFRWVIAILVLAASWGFASDASAWGGGGGNPEPGGNTPSNFKLSGPAIIGQMQLQQQHDSSGSPISGGTTLVFNGTCKGKEVLFQDTAWRSTKLVRAYTRNCSGNVDDCIANGGYVESTVLEINADSMVPALSSAGCDDVFFRNPEQFSFIKLFVQAVPYFRYDASSDVLFTDVVLLFLIPTAK